jgi:sodium-dependent phosphate cotransporter
MRYKGIIQVIKGLFFLYLFLLSIKFLGEGLGHFTGFCGSLIAVSNNRFIGLFIGILVTSIAQSSSVTTSIVVGLVSIGRLPIPNAIPIIMGANIGTTVTALLVSLGHITRKEEFRKAFSAAVLHDFFKVILVFILLPIEILTGYLEKAAGALASVLAPSGSEGIRFTGPIKLLVNPVAKYIKGNIFNPIFSNESVSSIAVCITALILLFVSLYFITKIMKSAMLKKAEVFLDRTIGKAPILGLMLGLIVTAIIQSSSVTTAILVPMVAAGIMNLEQMFPIELGANIGTTVTALLASLTGEISGLTIALCHLLFNVTGVVLVYPIPAIRRIPVRMASAFSELVYRNRAYAFVYVGGVFFAIPCLLIFWQKIF